MTQAQTFPPARSISNLLLLALFLWVAVSAVPALLAAPVTSPPRVLIIDETVIGGAGSFEAVAAATVLPGCVVDIVTAANWGAIPPTGLGGPTGYGYDSYRAIIFGDPECASMSPGYLSALSAINLNKLVWSPVITGNIIIEGVDNAYHTAGLNMGASNTLTRGIAFAVNNTNKTGLYYAMSCYYDGPTNPVPVPHLSGFGTFMTRGYGNTCFNDCHIVATHPVFTAAPPMTDADLSNWSCSTHEGFDVWPPSFVVLAIALTNGVYAATDGSNGVPYILVRGEGVKVITSIDLQPPVATNNVGTSHTVCATIATNVFPRTNVAVTFTITSGPNAVTNYTTLTDVNGTACFTYTGLGGVGTDYITASYLSLGATGGETTITSGTVAKIWAGACVSLGCEDLQCNPDATWSYHLCVTNLTTNIITFLSFQNLSPGVTFNPTSTNLIPALNPGQSATFNLTISSTNAAGSFCFLVNAFAESPGIPPCSIPRCLTLPTCCNRVLSNQLVYASSTLTNTTYNYQITIQNITGNPIKYVGFAATQPCVTFSPPLVDLTLPAYGGPSLLLPAQIRTINLQVHKAPPCPGTNIIYMSTFTSNLVACCSTKLQLPPAKCVWLVSPFSGMLVMTNSSVILRAIPSPISVGPCGFLWVSFYADSTFLGKVTGAPYEMEWVPNIPGTYEITAVATLESGEIETSDAADLFVLTPDDDPNHHSGGSNAGTLSASVTSTTVSLALPTISGQQYSIVYTTNLSKGPWKTLRSFTGDGTVQTTTDGLTNDPNRFYRALRGP